MSFQIQPVKKSSLALQHEKAFFSALTSGTGAIEDKPLVKGSLKPRSFLTGQAATDHALALAAQALEPASADRSPRYHSLQQRLAGEISLENLPDERQKNISVIATYGNIIIVADQKELTTEKDRARLVKQAQDYFQQLDKNSDKKSVSRTLAQKGLDTVQADKTPLIVRFSNNEEESIERRVVGTYYSNQFYTNMDPGEKVSYTGNYDEICLYANKTYQMTNGKILPPWIVLAHEVRHRLQYSDMRLKSLKIKNASAEAPTNANLHLLLKRDVLKLNHMTDRRDHNGALKRGGNGTSDNEDDAVIFMNAVARQAGVPDANLPAFYRAGKAWVFVDDPVQPTKILRSIPITKENREVGTQISAEAAPSEGWLPEYDEVEAGNVPPTVILPEVKILPKTKGKSKKPKRAILTEPPPPEKP